jgi:hypothetical protein
MQLDPYVYVRPVDPISVSSAKKKAMEAGAWAVLVAAVALYVHGVVLPDRIGCRCAVSAGRQC